MLSKNLKTLRAEKKLTQKQLAEKSKVSEQQISRYEKGSMEPNASALKRLADALGVTIGELEGQAVSTKSDTKTDIKKDPEVLLNLLRALIAAPLTTSEFEAIRVVLEAMKTKKDLQKLQANS